MKHVKATTQIVVLVLLASVMWTASLLYSQNTIKNNGKWISKKYSIEVPPVAAVESFLSRSMLAGAQLNLQKYFGHQEFLYAENTDLLKIEWKFKLNENSYLDFLFNDNGETFSGIRFSRHPMYPSIVFEADKSGRFLSQQERGGFYEDNKLYDVKIEENNKELVLRVGNRSPLTFSGQRFQNGKFGFGAGRMGAVVRGLEAVDKSGNKIEESFFNSDSFFEVLFRVVLALSIAIFAGGVALRFCFGQNIYFYCKKIALGLFVFGAAWFCFDFFYYSRLESYYVVPQGAQKSDGNWSVQNRTVPYINFESLRYKFFKAALSNGWFGSEKSEISKNEPFQPVKHLASKDVLRCISIIQACAYYNFSEGEPGDFARLKEKRIKIIYMGASFAHGSGANLTEDTFFRQVHNRVGFELYPKIIESTNYISITRDSETGSRLNNQIDNFFSHLNNQKYDIMLITFQPLYSDTLEGLERLFKNNKEKKIKTIYLKQPFNPDNPVPRDFLKITQKQGAAFEALMKKYEISTLELSLVLNEPEIRRAGLLWWDATHLRSYGQKIVADVISNEVLKYVRDRKN